MSGAEKWNERLGENFSELLEEGKKLLTMEICRMPETHTNVAYFVSICFVPWLSIKYGCSNSF